MFKDLNENETFDTILNGSVEVIQPSKGYRFSIDALLVAYFAHHAANGLAVDLGCGCGIISLLLLHQKKAKKLIGIEIQPELFELAKRNINLNNYQHCAQILNEDINNAHQIIASQSAKLVIANPPFFSVGEGKDNPNQQISNARRENLVTMKQIIMVAKKLVSGSGRVAMIYPAERLYELFANLESAKLPAKRIRMVHGKPDENARMVLVEAASRSGKNLVVDPPLILENKDCTATEEAERIVNGDW